jgi:hypothetical protein
MRALGQSTGHLDLFAQARVKRPADVFGETPVLTTFSLLQLARQQLGEWPEQFVDLGCGRGISCLTAASLGLPATGYEQEPGWVAAAQMVADRLQLAARFEAGDFLGALWPARALYFVVGTAYPVEMREEIALRLSSLGHPQDNLAVITGDWALPGDAFERLWSGRLPVDWGTAEFTLWKRQTGEHEGNGENI